MTPPSRTPSGDQKLSAIRPTAHRSAAATALATAWRRLSRLQAAPRSCWPEACLVWCEPLLPDPRPSGRALPARGDPRAEQSRRVPAGRLGASPAAGPPAEQYRAAERTPSPRGVSGPRRPHRSCAIATPPTPPTNTSAMTAETASRALTGESGIATRVDQGRVRSSRLLLERAGGVLGQCGKRALRGFRREASAYARRASAQVAPADRRDRRAVPRRRIVRLAPRSPRGGSPGRGCSRRAGHRRRP